VSGAARRRRETAPPRLRLRERGVLPRYPR
jgi:hypothetical protein